MELPVEFQSILDEAQLQRDGTVQHFKKFTFYLGKFGPFVERFPLEQFSDEQISTRIEALRTTLRNLPK